MQGVDAFRLRVGDFRVIYRFNLEKNELSLSYQAVGQPGTYSVQAFWSVDGVGGSEAAGMGLVIASASGSIIPTPPQKVSTPVLSPAVACSLPAAVSISCSDGRAQIYYTTDGTLPTQSSTPNAGPLTFNTQTSLRAVAFDNSYLPSVVAAGEYDPAPTITPAALAQSVSGNGGFLPTVNLSAMPQAAVICYAVVEQIPPGLTPFDVSGDGIWDPVAGVIRWGPYTDNEARAFSFNVGGASGSYALAGEVSCNGYSAGTTGDLSVQISANYPGPTVVTNPVACATDNLTYSLSLDPDPGVVTVTSASGTLNWGDGTQSPVTQPSQILQHAYTAARLYTFSVTAYWTGYTTDSKPQAGTATFSGSVQVVTNCLPPQIVVQPSSQMGLAGSTVQFAVSPSSPVPIAYQWYFNQDFPLLGAVYSLLTLPGVTPQSSGGYSVVLTNAFGSTTSSVASLMIVSPLVAQNGGGSVAFNFGRLADTTTIVWATTNLSSPVIWQPIFTNTTATTNGTWQFMDTNTVGTPAKFYRFSTP